MTIPKPVTTAEEREYAKEHDRLEGHYGSCGRMIDTVRSLADQLDQERKGNVMPAHDHHVALARIEKLIEERDAERLRGDVMTKLKDAVVIERDAIREQAQQAAKVHTGDAFTEPTAPHDPANPRCPANKGAPPGGELQDCLCRTRPGPGTQPMAVTDAKETP